MIFMISRGNLDVAWIHGSPAGVGGADAPDGADHEDGADGAEPLIQVHAHDERTVILRQSKAVHYEAPFLYLLFGADRAILFDTGATEDPATFPLRVTVDGLIADWLARHPWSRSGYGLVVAHTHGHGDHIAADVQFAGRPDTTVIGPDLDSVREFFGFDAWPDQTVAFDLGGRTLELISSPGHEAAAITVYDPATGFLLTGDTVYPGRLYAGDYPAFVATLDRIVAFSETHQVSHVMGCHIEMTRKPGVDYPSGSRYQPDEVPLQLTVARLVAVRDAARAVADQAGIHPFDDFIIYNGV